MPESTEPVDLEELERRIDRIPDSDSVLLEKVFLWALLAELRQHREREAGVRELHQPHAWKPGRCSHCPEEVWPCPTIQALEDR